MAVSDEILEELFGASLGEFTRARDEIAKRLRSEGRPDEAEIVRGLRKPTLVAWTLDMLPRLRPRELERLLAAGERAGQAQAEALAGQGDPKELRAAVDSVRREAQSLASEAGEILVKDGHAAREETLRRVALALETSAVTAEGREALRAGVFAVEPEPSGFGVLGGVGEPPSRGAGQRAGPTRTDKQREARETLRQLNEELRRLTRDRSELERSARDAEREALAKEREAGTARDAAERARQLAEEARAAEVEAKQRLRDAKRGRSA